MMATRCMPAVAWNDPVAALAWYTFPCERPRTVVWRLRSKQAGTASSKERPFLCRDQLKNIFEIIKEVLTTL